MSLNQHMLRGQVCACGRPAVKMKQHEPVCERCDRIEQYFDKLYHPETFNVGSRQRKHLQPAVRHD